MSNMSYCRFRNTLADLDECYEALEEGEDEIDEDGDPISKEEKEALVELIKLCKKIYKEYGHLAGEE